MKKRIAVFFGGNSNESEISVITGMLAVNLLRSVYEVVPVYLLPGGGMATGNFRGPADFKRNAGTKFLSVRLEGRALYARRRKVAELDCALNCCHGGMGEDGTLAALFRFHGLPSASPETPMSAVSMDKTLTKFVAEGLNIPTVRGFTVREEDEKRELWEGFSFPVIVKPARLGSSIGIKVAKSEEEYARALGEGFRLDGKLLVEEYLEERRDLNCAACRLGGKTVLSPVEEALSARDILTFSEKYEGKGGGRVFPADITEELAEKIHTYTKRLYEALDGRGVVRADFLLAGEKLYFNELNAVPGSLGSYLFGESLSKCRDFLVSLVEEAMSRPPMSKTVLVSGILEGEAFSGGKSAKRRS